MIAVAALHAISRARLRDAQALSSAKRYDGAVYLCGYAIEIALKARICRTLKWAGFPEMGKEFAEFKSFQTHNLETLLQLSGVEAYVRRKHAQEWSQITVIAQWGPELRYSRVGTATRSDAEDLIAAARPLVHTILGRI